MSARKALINTLTAEGTFPAPTGDTRWRSIRVVTEKPRELDHFIEVLLPVGIDDAKVLSEVDDVRVVTIHEDRPWFATAL
jgi:hypothetical protein